MEPQTNGRSITARIPAEKTQAHQLNAHSNSLLLYWREWVTLSPGTSRATPWWALGERDFCCCRLWGSIVYGFARQMKIWRLKLRNKNIKPIQCLPVWASTCQIMPQSQLNDGQWSAVMSDAKKSRFWLVVLLFSLHTPYLWQHTLGLGAC